VRESLPELEEPGGRAYLSETELEESVSDTELEEPM